MQISDLLTPERVACDWGGASKKRILEDLSKLMAIGGCQLTEGEIFNSLISRERLGSTGFGHGVAIPHGRVPNCDRTTAAFIKLKNGVDFDAVDGRPVDLLFALLVPEQSTDEHLELLSMLAEMFSDGQLLDHLREATTPETLYELLSNWRPKH